MSESWKIAYERWRDCPSLDPALRLQLDAIRDNEELLLDHFYKPLAFGTGGMRGELGPGINRMNRYTVRSAAAGLALYVAEHGEAAKKAGVAIAYDSRHQSADFALEAAKVLGHRGIHVYLFDRVFPTPLLSFAVRRLHAFAGIVITASHNPPEYNGFKVYGADGGQITQHTANRVTECIAAAGNELAIEAADEHELRLNGFLATIGDSVIQSYLAEVQGIRIHNDLPASAREQIRIVFTPLHGTTCEAITTGLAAFGYPHVTVAAEQAQPDPDFSTVTSPNPEDPEVFSIALTYASQVDADLVIGTDPDGDRLGVLVKKAAGEYIALTGNQIGSLLLFDLLTEKQKKGVLPPNGIVLKTIVTSEMGRAIAEDFSIAVEDTLTGFKYIGEKISQYEKSGEYCFQFGYEESFGYLAGDFVRDKDAVQTALLLADACAFYKAQGESLYDVLLRLFTVYGFYQEELITVTCKGVEGMSAMKAIMSTLRNTPASQIGSAKVAAWENYMAGIRFLPNGAASILDYPRSDVIKYVLDDGSWWCIRPSGTEPKLKLYLGTKGTSLEDAKQKLSSLKQEVLRQIRLSAD